MDRKIITKFWKLKEVKKVSVLLLLILSFDNNLSAQVFGNEWINFNQQYYKIPVTQTGMYRITQAELSNAGINGINPKSLQIFHRGKEQAIFVQGESDNTLDSGDYLEFYGKRNDGYMDYFLYGSTDRQVNPYYNIFSDTTAYFLTWTVDNSLGKRMNNINTPVLTPFASYHWKEELSFFNNRYDIGQNYTTNTNELIYLSRYDDGEGWAGNTLNLNQSQDQVFSIQNLQTGVPNNLKPSLQIVTIGDVNQGTSFGEYKLEVRIGTSVNNLRLIGTVTSYLHTKGYFQSNVEFTDINASQCIIRCTVIEGAASLVYFKLYYPQTYTMDGQNSKWFKLPTSTKDTTYLEIDNPPSNYTVYDMTDTDNITRLTGNVFGGKLRIGVSGTTDDVSHQIWVHNQATLQVQSIKPISFLNINPQLFDYLIVTHPSLRKSAGGFPDIVQAYADYRASSAGGNYKPLIMNIDVIYNQFSYGEKTPWGLRQFADYMYQRGRPKHIFLIGQAISLPEQYNPLDIRNNPTHYALDLVPTYGFPPSDIAIVAGLANRGTAEPSIPIGRLATRNPQEILNYLDKVKEHEAVPLALWQKNIIHLSGGNNANEQGKFKQYLNNMANIAKGSCSNFNVYTSYKTTTEPVEIINISGLVNEGASLITFFGHSSLELTDIEIGKVSDDLQGYRNKGKYPLLIANGCELGSVFYNKPTLSQDWIHTRDRGSIAFIAHCYFGYEIPLYGYSTNFYDLAFRCSWAGKTIGQVIKEHIEATVSIGNPPQLSTAQQMILQGDPAIRFIKWDKSDYYTADNQILLESFDDNPVSANSDSFKLKIVVSNLGLKNALPLKVKVKRTYTNGTQTEFVNAIGYPPVNSRDTLVFVIYKENSLNAYGINRFQVILDYNNEISEVNESNNIGTLEYFIPALGVSPLLPLKYAIVNEQPVLLTGLATNLTNTSRQIIFEIDTTKNFNSSVKQSTIINYSNTPSWSVNLLSDNSQDSTVYYWRVNYADAINNPNVLWGESSFVYIKNSPDGWSQSRFPQFSESKLTNLESNNVLKRWDFVAQKIAIEVKTFGNTSGGTLINDLLMSIDGSPQIFSDRCGDNHFIGIAFDYKTGNPYRVSNQNICGRTPEVANYFTNELMASQLTNYMGGVKEGDYVLFFSIGTINFSAWSNTMWNVLGSIGGNPTIYHTLQNGHPYAILGRKGGAMGTATEVIATNQISPTSDFINLKTNINLVVDNGEITSSRIGPAKKWKELDFDLRTSTGDTYQLDLYGIDNNFQVSSSPLISDIKSTKTDLTDIDATSFPYLQLQLNLKDPINKTPAQLRKWLVLYDGLPEGAMDIDAIGASAYVIGKKTEGENFKLDFAFKNISNLVYSSDSLIVRYSFINLDTRNPIEKTAKIKAPLPKETIKFALDIATLGMGGKNELKIFVNPPDSNVPEVYYENNFLIVNFEVQKDNANPILEVAFDGKKILDGEIVSPSPIISINLRDDNQYFLPKDPSNLNLQLKRPCESCNTFEPLNLNQATWSVDAGVLKVHLKMDNLESGKYTLKAQGTDAFGNKAGKDPYQINFEVVRESSVTNFFPYPNPFSTSTRFVFTLTGAEIPDEIKIQIMTVSGKVVREITQNELGPIRIGNNQTEFAWDGTDEFGDKLANGVYLYRVILRNHGQTIEQRTTNADRAFKHGIGKLYISR